MATAPTSIGSKPRGRRTASYWEPIFAPDLQSAFPLHDWNFAHTAAPRHVTLRDEELKARISSGTPPRFDKIRFVECDFLGLFDIFPREIVFNQCEFEKCDFGLSTWRRAKFSKCKFIRTSFSQTNFRECDFRSCDWKEIGLSGNATDISGTIITNPSSFVGAAFTNTDDEILKTHKTSAAYQSMRLESTKATVARGLARMLQNIGDEAAYYDAVRASSNQSSMARLHEAYFDLTHAGFLRRVASIFRLLGYSLELIVLNAAGVVNAWGRSISRPFLIGAAIIAVYALAYFNVDKPPSWSAAVIKSTEVTLLVGYTNHSQATLALGPHLLVLSNMLIGLLWYVVFIPTLVNRISRIR